MIGGPPQAERYPGGEVIESPQAVAVVPVRAAIGPHGWQTTAGFLRQVTVRLQAPLGARVHVDLHGNPVEVRTNPGPASYMQ